MDIKAALPQGGSLWVGGCVEDGAVSKKLGSQVTVKDLEGENMVLDFWLVC